jgi:hypothetical protein
MCGGIGFPASATVSDFHPDPRGLFRPPSTPSSDEASSSLELPASCRVLRPARCPSHLAEPRDPAEQPKSASLGVLVPHRGISNRRPPIRGESRPRGTFRPRRFSRPRRFPPPIAFAGLFHPAATSRVCPSGVCPSLRSRTGFPRPIHALLVLGAPACDQRMRPHLQGFAPRLECGAARDGLGPDRSAPLVGFPLLRVLSPRRLGMPSHSLRPRPWPRRTPRGRPPAFPGCAGWLAWNQAADPLELSGLNPRPSSRKVGFEATSPAVHRAAGHEEP